MCMVSLDKLAVFIPIQNSVSANPSISQRFMHAINHCFRKTWMEVELKKQVTAIYNTLSFLLEKKKVLMQTDSLYNSFLEKATQRFTKGESNVLEKTTAQNQKGQIALQ